MTTAIEPQPRFRTGMRMSLEEYIALGETDESLELFGGVLYLLPAPSIDHQFVMAQLCVHFAKYLDQFELSPAEMYHQITTILSVARQNAVEPDLVVILNGRDDIGGRIHVEGVPDIIAEILYTNRSHDLVYKRRIYAESSVKEYWIVDPCYDTVLPLALQDGVYPDRPALGVGDTLTTPLLPGLTIPLADLFQHRRRRPVRDAGYRTDNANAC